MTPGEGAGWRAMPDLRWLALITAGAAVIRFATLDLQSFAYDEVFTADVVIQHGLGETLSTIRHTESTPPLYYVLAWLWSKPFGTGEVGLRSLSALLGTALVPVTYAAGAALGARRAGLIAALLVAVSPAFVWYSQQARAYILLALLVAAGLFFFGRALERGDRRSLAGWAVCSALGLATHYFAAFIVVPEAVWLLASVGHRRRAIGAVAGVAVAGVALLPLAIEQQSAGHADYIADLALGKRLEQVPKLFLIGPQGGYGLLPALVLALAVGGSALVLRRASPAQRRPALIWGGLAAAAVVLPLCAAAAGIDFVFARNLLPSFIPATLFFAAALSCALDAAPAPRHAASLALAALAVLFAACVVKTDLDPGWQRTDWRWAADVADRPAERRLIVVNSLGEVPLAHYMPLKPAPARVAGVSEIVYAGEQLSDQLAASALPGGMTLAERRTEGKLRYRRYVAPAPIEVTRASVAGRDPRFYGRPVVLIDDPPGPVAGG